jgi:hypothetical protein
MVISRHLLNSYGLFDYVKFVEFFGVEFLDVFFVICCFGFWAYELFGELAFVFVKIIVISFNFVVLALF